MEKLMKKKPTRAGETVAKEILSQYQPQSVEEMHSALKDIFGPMFEAMLQGELSGQLGYANNDHRDKVTTDRRNGYTPRQ